jgi:hypothetical protein
MEQNGTLPCASLPMTSAEELRQLLDETNQLISIFVASIKTLHSSSGDGLPVLRSTHYAYGAPHSWRRFIF